jgi:hypothetical protein
MRDMRCEEPRTFARGSITSGSGACWRLRRSLLSTASFLRGRSWWSRRGGSGHRFRRSFLCSASALSCGRTRRLRSLCAFHSRNRCQIFRSLRGIRWRSDRRCRSRARHYSNVEQVRRRATLRSHWSTTDATRAHAALYRYCGLRRRCVRYSRCLELTLDSRSSSGRSDFVIASTLAQIDHVRIVRVVKNANEVALAETLAVTSEQCARSLAYLRC